MQSDPALNVPEVPWLGVAAADLDTGRIFAANGAFLEMLGYTREELERDGLGFDEITHPSASETTRAAFRELLDTGRMRPFEKAYARKDGSVRYAWITAIVAPGQPRRVIVYTRDTTEQRCALEALRESEERARRLAEASFEGLFVHDGGRIVDVNDVLPAMFRTTREAMLGRHCLEYTHPSLHPTVVEKLENQYELPYEGLALRADGTSFPVEVIGKSLPMGGRMLRVTALRDISERKRTEEALREAQSALQSAQKLESLGLLAGGIAHDFNNLLAVITGFASIAQRHIAPSSPAADAVSEIERAARRAAELARQMLVYSGRSPKRIGPIAMNEVVREMTSLLSASLSKKVAIVTALAEPLPPIAADRAQVEQVVLNLLTNAGDAIGDARGTIRVSTEEVVLGARDVPSPSPGEHLAPGRYVALTVQDSGCGMDAETLQRIFDPFFTTKETGRGLGLSTMLGTLRGHRAGLTISSARGEGSTFRLCFPIAGERGATTPKSAPPPPRPVVDTEGAVVLIADDEPALRRSTRGILTGAGYRVLEASNGVEAIDVFRRHARDVQLVLLDLHMPVAGGREALDGIRAIDPDARVLLTSGFDVDEVLDAVRDERVDFVPKPSSAPELLAAVHLALARS